MNSINKIIAFSLVFFSTMHLCLGQKDFCSYPVIVTEHLGSSILQRYINVDSVKQGSYIEPLDRYNNKVVYKMNCDSLIYYFKISNKGHVNEFGTYSLNLAVNDSIMLQNPDPPYDVYDTVMTYLFGKKIGGWFYFDDKGNIIKQEFHKH